MKFLGGLLTRFEEKTIALLMAVAVIVGFAQVASRFVFKVSLPWSEELLRFVFIWVTFLAASLGVREKSHVGVSILVDRLPEVLSRVVAVIGTLFSIGFCVTIAYYGSQLVKMQFETIQLSTAMGIPMWVPYLGVVVGSSLMAIRFIQNLAQIFTNDVKEA